MFSLLSNQELGLNPHFSVVFRPVTTVLRMMLNMNYLLI